MGHLLCGAIVAGQDEISGCGVELPPYVYMMPIEGHVPQHLDLYLRRRCVPAGTGGLPHQLPAVPEPDVRLPRHRDMELLLAQRLASDVG